VPVPGGIPTDLIVIEAGLVLRGLEALLDRPPAAGQPNEFGEWGVGRPVADVVGDLLRGR